MVIPIQYKYNLQVYVKPESVRDPNTGNWSNPAGAEWVDFGKCRDEANGKGGKVLTADGEEYIYFWTVYCPLTVNPVKLGSLVRVVDNAGNIRAQKNLVHFRVDQMNVKLWL